MSPLSAIDLSTMGVRLFIHPVSPTCPIYVGYATPTLIGLAHAVGLYKPVWHPQTVWTGSLDDGKLFIRAASLIGPISIGMHQLDAYAAANRDNTIDELYEITSRYLRSLIAHPTAHICREWCC